MGLLNNDPTPPSSSSTSSLLGGRHELIPVPHYSPQTPCSLCNLKSSGINMFTCKTCKTSTHHLHRSCAEYHQACTNLPKSYTHPSHSGCPLSLVDPPYPGGTFVCNGCSKPGDQWCYHCPRCKYDLHVRCIVRPLKIMHKSHPSCELSLAFSGPSLNSNGFMCDVCRTTGLNQWRYRCASCDFDVHMGCDRG